MAGDWFVHRGRLFVEVTDVSPLFKETFDALEGVERDMPVDVVAEVERAREQYDTLTVTLKADLVSEQTERERVEADLKEHRAAILQLADAKHPDEKAAAETALVESVPADRWGEKPVNDAPAEPKPRPDKDDPK